MRLIIFSILKYEFYALLYRNVCQNLRKEV